MLCNCMLDGQKGHCDRNCSKGLAQLSSPPTFLSDVVANDMTPTCDSVSPID